MSGKAGKKCYASLSDEELCAIVSGSKGAEAGAGEELFSRYRGFIKAKVRPYFLVGGDSEDLIQEGMIGLYNAIRDYSPDRNASFRTFAELCITRQVLTAIKAATRTKHKPLNDYVSFSSETGESDGISLEDQIEDDSPTDPEEIVIESESFRQLMGRISSFLSSYENKVLKLYLDGHSYSSIAETLGKPPKSIDNALQRIKSKLEKNPGLLTK